MVVERRDRAPRSEGVTAPGVPRPSPLRHSRYALGLRDDGHGRPSAVLAIRARRYLPAGHIHHLSLVVDRQMGSGQVLITNIDPPANALQSHHRLHPRRPGRQELRGQQ